MTFLVSPLNTFRDSKWRFQESYLAVQCQNCTKGCTRAKGGATFTCDERIVGHGPCAMRMRIGRLKEWDARRALRDVGILRRSVQSEPRIQICEFLSPHWNKSVQMRI